MVKVGPRELMGRMAIEVEGGSTAPENVPQQRQDAQMFVQLSQDPRLDGAEAADPGAGADGRRPARGLPRAAGAMQIPADQVEQFLAQLGVPPEMFVQFLDQQQQPEPQQPQGVGGPTVNGAMGAAMGGDPNA